MLLQTSVKFHTYLTGPLYTTGLNPTEPATNNSNTISIHADFRAVPL